MFKLLSISILLASAILRTAVGFAPVQNKQPTARSHEVGTSVDFVKTSQPLAFSVQHRSRHLTTIHSKINDDDQSEIPKEFWNNFSINPPYAIAFVSFLAFAFYRSLTEPEGASMQVLEGFFADPLNPGCNELFVTIFNLLGLYFVPLACLLMPGAKGQKLPATPFVLASMLGGYGFLGPYMITRKPSLKVVKKNDLDWFTANVLENKIVNWLLAAVIASAYISSGCISALLNDPSALFSGYEELFSETAIASASSMDFLILTLVAASLVPEDLARRGVKDSIAPYAIAASTVLLPGVGAALYCALRPELEEQ
jgi:hypothetical protein